ncbi:hypothetical protein [Thermospira aquatica]|uniref:Uncharacterized protein n=1 Tax=Thermospira aquatica TaxID=2828656 RepID=A0AAX3BFM9_9SPIR|nr:hypothetical protein [Thermospira aquatica]URA11089.1 hypothetical protein KDW03_04640 [Thermospira aquatica]
MRKAAVFFLFFWMGVVLWGQERPSDGSLSNDFAGEIVLWPELPRQRFRFVLTNTTVISNVEVIAGVTNWKVSQVETVYEFYDAFDDVLSVDPAARFASELAELIWPADWYHFPVEIAYLRWQKRSLRKASVELLSTNELVSFSQDILKDIQQTKRQKERFALTGEAKPLAIRVDEWESEFVLSGWFTFRTGFGWVWKDPAFLQPVGNFSPGLEMAQNLRFNLLGKIGQRVNVSVSHQSDNPENTYFLQYKALESDRGAVREVLLGNVDMQIPQKGALISTEGIPKQGIGVLGRFQMGNLSYQSLLHISGTQKGYKRFIGSKQQKTIVLRDIHYLKRMYFLLPDGSIDQGSIEVLLQTNVLIDRSIDGLYYKRLVFMQDYTLNFTTGELILKTSVARDKRLVVRYTHGGLPFSSPGDPDWEGTDDNTGEAFLYLWREDKAISPYMHYGVYNLGSKNFDPGQGFDLRVVYTVNTAIDAPFQFSFSDYKVFPSLGVLWFYNRFPVPGSSNLYTNYTDPGDSDSLYSLVCTYYEPTQSFQLDYNVIPGSESVFINGRKLSSWEYILVSATGELILNQMGALQENDVIEVYYEYKPFYGSGVQRFTWANRWDYPVSPVWNIGGTVIATIAQRGEEGAKLPQSPDGVLLASVDNTIDLGSFFGWGAQNRWTLQLETAVSLYDPNTSGVAIVEDFEGGGGSFQLSKSEYRWVLAAPLTNIVGISLSNRARLLYRDYREYKGDGTSTLIPYYQTPFAVYAYSDKPGLYMALGGHLPAADYPNVVQNVLVWDYDFSSGEWGGAVYSFVGGQSINMSRYDEIVFWAKIETDDDGDGVFSENISHEVEFFLAVGNLPEDSDGDGILDAEKSSQDLGYIFNDPTNGSVLTRVGIGRFGKGDGIIQLEDLNANGVLDTDGNWVVVPAAGVSSPTNLILHGSGWKEYRIRIDQLSSQQLQALQQATAAAVYIKKKNGLKGRVLIDGITFQTTKWQRLSLDGENISPLPQWRTALLTTFTSAQYQKYRFYDPWSDESDARERYTTFEKLHKMRSKTEALQYEEKALGLFYALSNTGYNPSTGEGGTNGFVWQYFNSGLSIGKYEQLAFYLFVLSTGEDGTPIKYGGDSWDNETFVFVMGSSTNDIYTWSIPLKDLPKERWQKVEILLDTFEMRLNDTLYKPTRRGNPYLHEVKAVGFGIAVNGGEPVNRGNIWINEIHVTDDKSEVGWATLASTTLDWRKPLWIWNGYEIMGPLLFNGRTEWRSDVFRSSLAVTNTTRNAETLLVSGDAQSSLLRSVDYRIYGSWLTQSTKTNENELPLEYQFFLRKNTGGFTTKYKSSAWIPEVFHAYGETTEKRLFYASSLGQLTTLQSASGKWALKEQLPWTRNISHVFEASYEYGATLDIGTYVDTPDVRLSNRAHTLSHQKSLKLSLIQTTGQLAFSAGYGKAQQKYRSYNLVGDLDYEGSIFAREGSIGERYVLIQQGLMEGFDWPDPFWQKDEENFSWGMQLDRPWPWLYLENKSWWGRVRGSFSYNDQRYLLFFQTAHGLTNQWSLNLYPRWVWLDTLGVSLTRQARLWYQSNQDPLRYQDVWETTGRVFYVPPWEYQTFALVSARSNALTAVSLYTNLSGSQYSFDESWRWEWILPRYDNVWDLVFPKRYRYDTILATSRMDLGYSQTFSHTFATLSEFGWGRFLTNHRWYQINPLQLDLSLSWTENYLTRLGSRAVGGSLRQTIFFLKDVSLSSSYTYRQTEEIRITNFYGFETNYGFPKKDSALALKDTRTHSVDLQLSWYLLNLREVNLFGWRINLRGSTLQNTETLRFSWNNTTYDKPLFVSFIEPIYEITYDHVSRYQLTDYVTANLILRFINHQYREVVVIGGQRVDKPFQMGWGGYVAFDIGIKF